MAANGKMKRLIPILLIVLAAFVAGIVCGALLTPAVKAFIKPPDSPELIALRARLTEMKTCHDASLEDAYKNRVKFVATALIYKEIVKIGKEIPGCLTRESERREAERLYCELTNHMYQTTSEYLRRRSPHGRPPCGSFSYVF